MSPVAKLYQMPQTVFTFKDLVLLFVDINPTNLRRRVNYYAKTKQLLNPKPGIYTKTKFDTLELGSRIYTPSYVSLETVLAKEGMIFQYYDTIFLCSYLSRIITVGECKYQFRRLPRQIVANSTGIEMINNTMTATKERAFLDAVYLYKNYHFDNLSLINWDVVFDIVKIYESKIMERRVRKYYGSK